jgi:PAT family beta-lactamase induction signal transducer AmpG
LAGESFGEFRREVSALLRRREVLIALVLLLSPCSSFALTNLLGGLGGDFHASARVVSLAGGAGAFFPGILGCLLFPVIAKRRVAALSLSRRRNFRRPLYSEPDFAAPHASDFYRCAGG